MSINRIGQEIRSHHPYAYRAGKWALITSVDLKCGCYGLEWPDCVEDDWAINDPAANYEFRPHDPAAQQWAHLRRFYVNGDGA